MLNEVDLKQGTLIWWTAERYSSYWDCPGVIVTVDETNRTFTVKTFDTFNTTGNLQIPEYAQLHMNSRIESCVTEMRIATIKEVRRYLTQRERKLEAAVIKAREELEDRKDELSEYIEQAFKIDGTILSPVE